MLQRVVSMLFFLQTCLCQSAQAQWIISFDETYQESFNSLPVTGTLHDQASLPLGWSFIEKGTSADQKFATSNGNLSAGNTYSFGIGSDRGLGTLLSGSLQSTLIFTFKNTTEYPVRSIRVRYQGERWRVGSASRPDRLDFQYRIDTTSGSWIDCDSLDLYVPKPATQLGAADGNTEEHQQKLSALLNGVWLPPNAVAQFRWVDFDATGPDDGLAVDDFEMEVFANTQNYYMTIAGARTKNVGAVVTVAGRVSSQGTFGDLHFIQDQTGGIAVYHKASYSAGDSVGIRGKIYHHQGMVEIIPDSTWKFIGPAREVQPILRRDNDFQNLEGQLIRLQDVHFASSGLFFYPGQNTAVVSTQPFEYYIDENTDLLGRTIPADKIDITGIVSRFKDRLQLIPRSTADLHSSISWRTPDYSFSSGSIRIMNWNVQFFGASKQQYGLEYGPANDDLQLENVARLIVASKADIVALQEVSDPVKFDELVDLLPGFEGHCSKRYSHSDQANSTFPPQRLCFVFRTKVVRMVREQVLFEKLYDESKNGNHESPLAEYPGSAASFFSSGRLPYVASFQIRDPNINRTWHLINVHAKSGVSAQDHARRTADAQVLLDTISTWGSKEYLVLGDFNDEIEQSITPNVPSPYHKLNSELGLECLSCPLSSAGWKSTLGFNNMIDHQMASSLLSTQVVVGSTRVVNVFATIPNYGKTTSDHLPILTEFNPMMSLELRTSVTHDEESLIYPNPFVESTHLNCETILNVHGRSVTVQLVNSVGQTVFRGSGLCDLVHHELSVATARLPTGLYVVHLSAGDGKITLRVIKKE